jgi:hypothetical protein
MDGLQSDLPGAVGGNRLLHRGSAHAAWLVSYYMLFLIHLESRQVEIAGITGS